MPPQHQVSLFVDDRLLVIFKHAALTCVHVIMSVSLRTEGETICALHGPQMSACIHVCVLCRPRSINSAYLAHTLPCHSVCSTLRHACRSLTFMP